MARRPTMPTRAAAAPVITIQWTQLPEWKLLVATIPDTLQWIFWTGQTWNRKKKEVNYFQQTLKLPKEKLSLKVSFSRHVSRHKSIQIWMMTNELLNIMKIESWLFFSFRWIIQFSLVPLEKETKIIYQIFVKVFLSQKYPSVNFDWNLSWNRILHGAAVRILLYPPVNL